MRADTISQYLLLHGAGLGAWIWERVSPRLELTATALDLPGRTDGRNPGTVTLKDAVEYIGRALNESPGRSIVVAHSFSAEFAMVAAAAYPSKVAAITLVGGMVPESGKSFMSLMPPPQRLLLTVLLKRAHDGIALPQGLLRKAYCNDLDDATTELVLARSVREAPRLYLDHVDWSRLPDSVPRFFVKLLRDGSVTVRQQEQIAKRVRAQRVESLDSGHLPMLSRPEELVATLQGITHAIA